MSSLLLLLGKDSCLPLCLLFFRINALPAYKSILLLSGERGCGKSTLIASWVKYFKSKHPGVLMIPYFVGSTCESSDIMSVIHYFIMELQHRAHGNGASLRGETRTQTPRLSFLHPTFTFFKK